MVKVLYNFRVGKKTLNKFKRHAKASDMSVSELIRLLMLNELERSIVFKKGFHQ